MIGAGWSAVIKPNRGSYKWGFLWGRGVLPIGGRNKHGLYAAKNKEWEGRTDRGTTPIPAGLGSAHVWEASQTEEPTLRFPALRCREQKNGETIDAGKSQKSALGNRKKRRGKDTDREGKKYSRFEMPQIRGKKYGREEGGEWAHPTTGGKKRRGKVDGLATFCDGRIKPGLKLRGKGRQGSKGGQRGRNVGFFRRTRKEKVQPTMGRCARG